MQQCVRILIVTGASGAGKTTLVRRVADRGVPNVSFNFFDSIGVPALEEMVRRFGSTEAWQRAMTEQWIVRLLKNEHGLCVLEGQMRPSVVREFFKRHHVDGHMLLLDCSHDVREARLRDHRAQPELVTTDMACWAAYLRGQADALDLPIINTSALTIEAATDALHAHIAGLAAV